MWFAPCGECLSLFIFIFFLFSFFIPLILAIRDSLFNSWARVGKRSEIDTQQSTCIRSRETYWPLVCLISQSKRKRKTLSDVFPFCSFQFAIICLVLPWYKLALLHERPTELLVDAIWRKFLQTLLAWKTRRKIERKDQIKCLFECVTSPLVDRRPDP